MGFFLTIQTTITLYPKIPPKVRYKPPNQKLTYTFDPILPAKTGVLNAAGPVLKFLKGSGIYYI